MILTLGTYGGESKRQGTRGEERSKQVRREKVSCWMHTPPDCCSMMMMTVMVLDVRWRG
jgi:hypothetical protein